MLARFKKGLGKTRVALKNKFALLFGGNEINQAFFDELEEILLSADVGVGATMKIVDSLQERLWAEKIKERSAARELLKELLVGILESDHQAAFSLAPSPPTVFLILGVNGVGKTTTIGKMAYRFAREGKKVLLAAGDTFRAAAIEQLEEWSRLAGADLIKHQSGGDPSAVIYDALNAAVARRADLLICDTAGRLHTKVNLLEEIKKIFRVMHKILPGAPHETMLVLDATTGQNGLSQVKYFQEAVPLSGLILTKLDGTARGGIVIAIKDLTGVPLKLVGVGEKKEDLEIFQATEFVEALLA